MDEFSRSATVCLGVLIIQEFATSESSEEFIADGGRIRNMAYVTVVGEPHWLSSFSYSSGRSRIG